MHVHRKEKSVLGDHTIYYILYTNKQLTNKINEIKRKMNCLYVIWQIRHVFTTSSRQYPVTNMFGSCLRSCHGISGTNLSTVIDPISLERLLHQQVWISQQQCGQACSPKFLTKNRINPQIQPQRLSLSQKCNEARAKT